MTKVSQSSNIYFINTRPRNKSEELSTFLKKKGCKVFNFPLLEITPVPLTKENNKYLKDIHKFDVIVCISPTAVELANKYIENHINKRVLNNTPKWIAVGETTKNYLNKMGIKQVFVPHTKSNEGMLAMPIIEKLNEHDSVLLLRGKGGRRLLINELTQRQVSVTSIEFYQRQVPKNLLHIYHNMMSEINLTCKKTVLISSGESWNNWQSICKNILDFNYIVLGKRITEKLAPLGLNTFTVDDLQPETIYNAIIKMG